MNVSSKMQHLSGRAALNVACQDVGLGVFYVIVAEFVEPEVVNGGCDRWKIEQRPCALAGAHSRRESAYNPSVQLYIDNASNIVANINRLAQ